MFKIKTVAYTLEEQHILLDWVEEKKNVLESKETDKPSLRTKSAAWEEVTQGHNAKGPTSGPRTAKQLKKYVNNSMQSQLVIFEVCFSPVSIL
jgi:hypothetical protein